MELDRDFLQNLELSLDTIDPESSEIDIDVLGYGEISLVFSVPNDPAGHVAYKRLPIFSSKQQVEDHISAYIRYNELLSDIGLNIPEYGATWVYRTEDHDKITLFCAQHIVPDERVGNKLLHTMSDENIISMFKDILSEISKIWEFNAGSDNLQIGFDGQISNFALISGQLHYLDTSTPMYRVDGKDAMEGELFLKSAPPGIRFLLKLFFLQEVLDRYYDLRSVIIDLLANFFKEQREDLIPDLLVVTNQFIEDLPSDIGNLDILTEKEVRKYYRSDKFIWSLFQKMRSLHRFITTKILQRQYDFYLPPKIER